MQEVLEKLSYTKLIEGDIPPWVRRFIKHTGKAINTYSMIREGEKVLLSVSGGKDSLGLALALSLRRKWMPIDYELQALMINWIEHPIPEEFRAKLAQFFGDLNIDFSIKDEAPVSRVLQRGVQLLPSVRVIVDASSLKSVRCEGYPSLPWGTTSMIW